VGACCIVCIYKCGTIHWEENYVVHEMIIEHDVTAWPFFPNECELQVYETQGQGGWESVCVEITARGKPAVTIVAPASVSMWRAYEIHHRTTSFRSYVKSLRNTNTPSDHQLTLAFGDSELMKFSTVLYTSICWHLERTVIYSMLHHHIMLQRLFHWGLNRDILRLILPSGLTVFTTFGPRGDWSSLTLQAAASSLWAMSDACTITNPTNTPVPSHVLKRVIVYVEQLLPLHISGDPTCIYYSNIQFVRSLWQNAQLGTVTLSWWLYVVRSRTTRCMCSD
jgi:hypothetical protein